MPRWFPGCLSARAGLGSAGLAWPDRGRSFARRNLAALWPEYSAVPGARFVVCELTAPVALLMQRVAARGGNDYWQQRIRGFVELYAARTDLERIRDFAVSTDGRSEEDVAREVVTRAGWG